MPLALALALSLLAAPALAQSAAERADRALQEGIARDRVAEAERQVQAGGAPAPAVVDDLDAQRGLPTADRREATTSTQPDETTPPPVPGLLGDNPRR